jgi:hypothetical protein
VALPNKIRIVSGGLASNTLVLGPDGQPLPWVQSVVIAVRLHEPVTAVVTFVNVELEMENAIMVTADKGFGQ